MCADDRRDMQKSPRRMIHRLMMNLCLKWRCFMRMVLKYHQPQVNPLVLIDGQLIEKPVLRDMYRIVAIADRIGV